MDSRVSSLVRMSAIILTKNGLHAVAKLLADGLTQDSDADSRVSAVMVDLVRCRASDGRRAADAERQSMWQPGLGE